MMSVISEEEEKLQGIGNEGLSKVAVSEREEVIGQVRNYITGTSVFVRLICDAWMDWMGWMIVVSSPGRGWDFFSSQLRLDWLWGWVKGYQVPFPWRQKCQGVKLTTHLHLVLRSRMHGALPPLPNTFFGLVLI
jgi:hypothetical protein